MTIIEPRPLTIGEQRLAPLARRLINTYRGYELLVRQRHPKKAEAAYERLISLCEGACFVFEYPDHQHALIAVKGTCEGSKAVPGETIAERAVRSDREVAFLAHQLRRLQVDGFLARQPESTHNPETGEHL